MLSGVTHNALWHLPRQDASRSLGAAPHSIPEWIHFPQNHNLTVRPTSWKRQLNGEELRKGAIRDKPPLCTFTAPPFPERCQVTSFQARDAGT